MSLAEADHRCIYRCGGQRQGDLAWRIGITVLLMLLQTVHAADASRKAVLHDIGWKAGKDSTHLFLRFANERPQKYRVWQSDEDGRDHELQIEFFRAGLDSVLLAKGTAGIATMIVDDSTIRMKIPLTKATPWRAVWSESEFAVSFLRTPPPRPLLRNPWFLAGSGLALLAGGTTTVLLLDQGSKTSTTTDKRIPVPDAQFPF